MTPSAPEGVRQVTSLVNPAVKFARALHMRKERDAERAFLAEGLKIVSEAFELGRRPRLLLYGPDARDQVRLKSLVAAALKAGAEVLEVTSEILAKVSRRDNPQTVLGVFDQAYVALEALEPSAARQWVALENVRDPGNLGTIVRTADAAGCGGVVLIGECCDPYSVEAVRASMGSIFAVPLTKTPLEAFLAWRRFWPGAVIGALLTARTDYRQNPGREPRLLLLGNEQHGLSDALAAVCDVAVKIPMRGRADSLNLAVAAGVLIYAGDP